MIIYKATNIVNGKNYIGQAKNFLKRKSMHKHRMNEDKRNHYFYNALRKYGWRNFKWNVLCKCYSKEELDDMEFHYIKQYKSHISENGYNHTFGGEGSYGWIPSNRTKNKISEAKKGKSNKKISEAKIGISWGKHTEETKNKISESNKKFYENNIHHMKGAKHTEETKNKISKKRKENWKDGIYNTEEYRKKLSISAKRRCDNDDYKKKFVERMKKAKRKKNEFIGI